MIETLPRGLEFQTAGNPGLHAALAIDKTGLYTQLEVYDGNLFYLETDDLNDWASAWANRTRVTYDDDLPGAWVSGDHHMTVDSENTVHVIYEDFEGPLNEEPNECGYKASNSSFWSNSSLSVPLRADGFPCGHFSPTFFLWDDGVPGVAADTLHALLDRRGASCNDHANWPIHRKHALADSADVWSGDAYTTNYFTIGGGGGDDFGGGTAFVIDESGVMHILARQKNGTTLRLVHLWGNQVPAGETMTFQVDTLDTFTPPPSGAPEDEDPSAELATSFLRGPNAFIDVVWNYNATGEPKYVKFSRIPIGDEANNSVPIKISPDESVNYGRTHLSHDASGRVYAIYNRGAWQVTGTREFVSISEGDPTLQSNWTRGIPATPQVRTWATDGFIVARNDTLHVLYQSKDDDDDNDEDLEVWAQRGFLLPNTVPLGQTMTWSGNVYLDEDFVVPATSTLVIAAGTTVYSAATATGTNEGNDAGLVEIVVKGQLDAVGTAGLPIVFDRTTASPTGEWGGLQFDLEGCERTGYGYMGAKTPPSRLEHATVKNASVGAEIVDLVAPSFKNVTFDQITGERDIYLNQSDVYLPRGYWSSGLCNNEPQGQPFIISPADWSLTAGTDVVASNTSAIDGWYGDAGKVDLVAQAKLDALGAEGDSVKFRPETPALGTGDGWGGAILDLYAAGSQLKYVSIGEAPNPLFVFYADSSLTIRHSRIHHFADTGLWMDDTGPLGAVVDSCVIERGGELDEQIGFTAARLDQTDELKFEWNKLDLSGLNTSGTSSALDVYWGSSHCAYPAAGFDNFVVRSNWILGPGVGPPVQGSRNGMKAYYLCGSSTRSVLLDGNYVEDFTNSGMEIHQTKEAQVTCNTVLDVKRGLDFFRTSDITGQAVKFKNNWFEVKTGENQVVRTDDNVKTAFGPALSDRGDNGLLALNTDVDFVQEQDPNDGDKFNAKNCYWFLFDQSGPTETLITSSGTMEIADRLDPSADVQFTPVRETLPGSYCRPMFPPGAGGQSLLVRHPQASVGPNESPALTTPERSGGPAKTFIQGSTRGGETPAEIRFGVSPADAGEVRLEVFSIAGRRVVTLVNGPLDAGDYRLIWGGVDSAGRGVSAGVYFARLMTAEGVLTTKLVVIR